MSFDRRELEAREAAMLKPYAVHSSEARRQYQRQPDEYRTAFQQDVARITHSLAYRRLNGKTQVFCSGVDDHYRNRKTHTEEVALVARSLARSLGLNEDLTEAIALAHDLGHPPFGHAGERCLRGLLQPFGQGFEHNRQSYRIVTVLEKKYPEFDGLNLTDAVLEGLDKHGNLHTDEPKASRQPSLEAQVVDLADKITYLSHDLEDGLVSGILSWQQLRSQLALARRLDRLNTDALPPKSYYHQLAARLIDTLTHDLLLHTEQQLALQKIATAAEVRTCVGRVVTFSAEISAEVQELYHYLHANLYRSEPVSAQMAEGESVITQLFEQLLVEPERHLPTEFAKRLEVDPPHIVVTDYIAGMTDQYARDTLVKIS